MTVNRLAVKRPEPTFVSMPTAMGIRRRDPFNRGMPVEQEGEIELGHQMAIATYLLYGGDRCRRVIRKSPSWLFKRFRYGRRTDPLLGKDWLILTLHRGSGLGVGRATDEYIMTPASPD